MNGSANTVGIIGTGTMGAGIAQVAAVSGWSVRLADVDEATARAAIEGISTRLDRLVEKGKLTAEQSDEAVSRLVVAPEPAALAPCQLLLEAVVEDFDTKVTVLRPVLEALGDDAIIASNTSSLSISRLGEALGRAPHTVGMHFFNPAPLMKLVEVIAGAETDAAVVDRACAIAHSWGKITARAADGPGFIVNHVARPYYLEALRILAEGLAGAGEIDAALRDLGGFRMGPLELIDLIGLDVNLATTHSVWERLDRPPLLRPCPLQEKLVADGSLGRKTGRGVYSYEGETPVPALVLRRRPLEMSAALRSAVDDFVAAATTGRIGNDVHRYVFARILAGLIAQAALAHERGVATKDDIDTALKYGTNYPKGPFAWAGQIGLATCARLLEALNETVTDNRFAVPALLSSGA
ncbi:MAG: 3-hydroxyacyl-CoA dehydrogenase NAD-binding domain-containing protein [Planctomycetota bacterium]